MHFLKLVIPTLVLLSGCLTSAANQRIATLEAQVIKLNQEVESLTEFQAQAMNALVPTGPSQADEETAREIFMQLQAELTNLNNEKVKELHGLLLSKYAETEAGQYAQQLTSELNVIGVEAGKLDVDKWYSGESAMNDGKATLLVFWEKRKYVF